MQKSYKAALPASHGGKLKTNDVNARVLQVNGVPIHQNGRIHYLISLTAETVHDLMVNGLLKVDEWSMTNQDGYQRAPTQSRVKKFARHIRTSQGFSPVTALLYCRNQNNIETHVKDGVCELTITVDPENPLYIPDGQHRLYGLKMAVDADPKAADYELGCVLMVAHEGVDPRYEEASQFFTINTLQKKVPTDLAQRFMLRRAEQTTGEIKRSDKLPAEAKRDDLKPFAVAVVDMLNADKTSPWHDLIETPNEPAGSTRPISQNMFVDSILPLLKHGSEYGWNVGKVVDSINAFWREVADRCEDAMEHWNGDGCDDTDDDPHTYYVLRTTSGVISLNTVLKWMVGKLPVINDPTDQTLYAELMDLDQEHFSDAYWKAGEDAGGAALKGTSRAAFNEIASEIRGAIAEDDN